MGFSTEGQVTLDVLYNKIFELIHDFMSVLAMSKFD